jgi:hypothetical protein
MYRFIRPSNGEEIPGEWNKGMAGKEDNFLIE